MRVWIIGGFLWLGAVFGAFQVDRQVYENVAGPVAEKTEHKPWRFGRPYGRAGAPWLTEALALFERFGHVFFLLLLVISIRIAAPGRRWQIVSLAACVAFAALMSYGVVRPSVAKLRPDATLHADETPKHSIAFGGQIHNRGSTVYRAPFSGFARSSGLTFPSGHTSLAFATAAALGAMFPRARWWFLLLACGTGASRFVMGDHFLSDVIAGAGVGYASARIVLARPVVRAVMDAPPAA